MDMKNKYFIFDLDDTLFYEIDYLKSAYIEIANMLRDETLYSEMLSWYESNLNVFEIIEKNYNFSKSELISLYRLHIPNLNLNDGTFNLLQKIKSKGHLLGLITDGRSITQRNKLKSLQIESLFDQIIISEEFGSTKPCLKNYEVFKQKNVTDYFYIADNVSKDFISPNKLGWKTVCLIDKGFNIHKQSFDFDDIYLPKMKIQDLLEIELLL